MESSTPTPPMEHDLNLRFLVVILIILLNDARIIFIIFHKIYSQVFGSFIQYIHTNFVGLLLRVTQSNLERHLYAFLLLKLSNSNSRKDIVRVTTANNQIFSLTQLIRLKKKEEP